MSISSEIGRIHVTLKTQAHLQTHCFDLKVFSIFFYSKMKIGEFIKKYLNCTSCCLKPKPKSDEHDDPSYSKSNEAFEFDDMDKASASKKKQKFSARNMNYSTQSLDESQVSNGGIPLLRLTLLGKSQYQVNLYQ
jgi:hypothetical protein